MMIFTRILQVNLTLTFRIDDGCEKDAVRPQQDSTSVPPTMESIAICDTKLCAHSDCFS